MVITIPNHHSEKFDIRPPMDKPALARMQKALGAPHAFQAVMDLPYADADPFSRPDPVIVPARTLLSQLP